jgi:hypothetical protein
MTDISCPNCGQNALSIATRCPHCGQPFESRLWQSPASGIERRRIPTGLVITGVVIVLVVVGVAQREPRRPARYAPAPTAAASSDTTPPPPPSVVAVEPAESTPPIDPASQADSTPAAAEAPVAIVTTPAPVPPPAASPPAPVVSSPADPSLERRYASTWVNVRAGRNGSATVVQILKPGEAVRVDSLRQGWFRVVRGGQTLGYVDRTLVGTALESVSP